jgi:hypothetical protein
VTGSPLKIEILTISGCPNVPPTLALVRELLASEGLTATIEIVEVADDADVAAQGFLGSPTLRIDGLDIEPSRRGEAISSYACRVYRTPAGASGVPSRQMLRSALLAAG